MSVMSRRKGQVLIIAALAIALSILAVQVYLYDLSETSISSNFDSLSDCILSIEQGSDHVVETSLVDSGGWLYGWGKRVKLTTDSGDIDENLTDFPVLIYLSSSSGRNNDNLSFVFDEIQSESDRKKIAVTTSDGVTQCYAEIERWNATSEEAWLWVRVPSVSDSSNTELYLYFDGEHGDNSDYVGDVGEAAAVSVWDDDYVGVWHLSEDPSGAAPQMQNSKVDGSHGTSHGFMTSNDQVRGVVDGSLELDGFTDYVDFGNAASLDITGNITIEAWVRPDDFDGPPDLLTKGDYDEAYSVCLRASGEVMFGLNNNPLTSNATLVAGTRYHVVATRSGTTRKIFINGTEDISDIYGFAIGTTFIDLTLSSSGYPLEGMVDEIRLSSSGRSDAWVKASFESERDSLVDFEDEETVDTYYSGEAVVALGSYMIRWESLVGGDYAYGLCYLNSTPASQAPYSEGIWIDWGVDGVGVTGACSDYTFNISGRGAEVDLSFTVNMTTRVQVSGSYQDMGGDSKAVTVTMQLTKDGSPALYRDVTPEVMASTGWTDMTALGDYAEQDHGNGTYTYTFTADISGNDVPVRYMVHDERGIYVKAEITLSEG
jgi:hypothetical protein